MIERPQNITPPTMQQHYKGQALRYVLLPGVIPRFKRIFSISFGFTAYLIASLFSYMRLLPLDHPYLNPANTGRYGVRHVIAEAGSRLSYKWKNIDQIFIFFIILTGLVLLVLQFFFLLGAVFVEQPASAAFTIQQLFGEGQGPGGANPAPPPAQDLMFILLDKVFGVADIFKSCFSTAVQCDYDGAGPSPAAGEYPLPVHVALHSILQFFSLGIFFVAVIIILYFFLTITAETAATGSPFGQRLNRLWAPIRLIVFFALLLPLNLTSNSDSNESAAGLNGAQLIVLWTAKFGSNFASNAAYRFDQELSRNYLGEAKTLLATPKIPEIHKILEFLALAKTCEIATELVYDKDAITPLSSEAPHGGVKAYLVRQETTDPLLPGDDALVFDNTDFDTALRHANNGNITLRIGVRDQTSSDEKYKSQPGNVYGYCGEMTFVTVNRQRPNSVLTIPEDIQELYYNMVKDIWRDQQFIQYSECIVLNSTPIPGAHKPNCNILPSLSDLYRFHQKYYLPLTQNITALIENQLQSGDDSWADKIGVQKSGWFGLSLMYYRIADENGRITSAIFNLPLLEKYPDVLETIARAQQANSSVITEDIIFRPRLPTQQGKEGIEINYKMPQDDLIAVPLYIYHKLWNSSEGKLGQYTKYSGNVAQDLIDAIIGAGGIYSIKENAEIHPLAQLTVLGKSMMEATIRNIGLGWLGDGASKILGDLGKSGKIITDFFKTIGFTFLAMSFLLFYVLPFMPFLYFFFAAVDWVKTIFEAVVAMPLWALAHIRIDGDGLPGPVASGGYFMIFEIFLRPILIVFGFLISISMFSHIVYILNDIFDVVVMNVTGFDMANNVADVGLNRSALDQLAFTAIYVVVVYMIGNSCFKLVDMVPQKILRWMGSNVAVFRDFSGNGAESVQSTTYSGILMGTRGLKGGALGLLQ